VRTEYLLNMKKQGKSSNGKKKSSKQNDGKNVVVGVWKSKKKNSKQLIVKA